MTMRMTTQDEFADFEITQTLGLVKGNTIRARHIGNDILAGLRNLVGGEITEYTKLLGESREQSIDRMVTEPRRRQAVGIVAIRFITSPVMQGSAELLAYGTAVKFSAKT